MQVQIHYRHHRKYCYHLPFLFLLYAKSHVAMGSDLIKEKRTTHFQTSPSFGFIYSTLKKMTFDGCVSLFERNSGEVRFGLISKSLIMRNKYRYIISL